jgi:alpha-beta hydrolase superfamily lysophospholipase
MRRNRKILLRTLFGLTLAGAGLWAFGPYEPVDLKTQFEPRRFGEGIGVYLEVMEMRFDDITPGVQKRVIWAGPRETRTPLSVLYVHGFSATSEEIRPVPDRIAADLGANLVFTRLRGHGRGSDALAGPTVHDWMQDMAEALALARATGDRVIVIATSTGATLAAAAALDPELSESVAAMIFVSPNFGINDPFAFALTLPAARWWVPLVAGHTRSFPPSSPDHGKYWTTTYPTVALLSMTALVKAVSRMDFAAAQVPILVRLSDADRIVRSDMTRKIAARWGGPVTVQTVAPGPGIDPASHVIAGDILSPAQTEAANADMARWLSDVLEQ